MKVLKYLLKFAVCTGLAILAIILVGCASPKSKLSAEQKKQQKRTAQVKVLHDMAAETESFQAGESMRVATFGGSYRREQLIQFYEQWRKDNPHYEIIGEPKWTEVKYGFMKFPQMDVVFKMRPMSQVSKTP